MIGIGTFQEVSPSDVRVRLNYGKAQVCEGCGGPFMWIRRNSHKIDPIVDSQEVIRLMKPPLEFSQRKYLFVFVGVSVALILAWTAAFTIYMSKSNKNRDRVFDSAAYVFFAGILLLVIAEFSSLIYWSCRFRNKLIDYVEQVNAQTLHPMGAHFYFNEHCSACLGANTAWLGIRKWDRQEQEF